MKSLKNLSIILLICLIATGFPIESFSSFVNTKQTITNENNNVTILSSNIDDYNKIFKNPNQITIIHKSTEDNTLNFYDSYLLKANIYRDNKLYTSHNFIEIPNADFFALQISKDDSYNSTIDISQENLKLPNGNYKIIISSNAMELKYSDSSVVLNVSYQDNVPYVPATSIIPKGKTALTLYFPENISNNIYQLVGITRFVNYTSNPHKEVINELQKGPILELNLSEYPAIGKVNYVVHRGNIAYIDLPSSEEIYTSYGSDQSAISLNSFLKSLTSLNNIDKIRFTIDNKVQRTFFDGVSIDKSIPNNMKNKAYLCFDSYTRYFLIDCDIDGITNETPIEDKINQVMLALKESNYSGLSNTIPENVNLLDFNIKNNTLSLDFNRNFLNSFDGNENLQRMMLDSIVLSFTSIDNIKHVQILVENEIISNFIDLDISNPLSRPLYINPELEINQ